MSRIVCTQIQHEETQFLQYRSMPSLNVILDEVRVYDKQPRFFMTVS